MPTPSDSVPSRHVAVVGAGISGLMAARTLQEHGFQVSVFEKSRGTGGRAATRRADPNLSFDHGAQYFTARESPFVEHVEAWLRQGIVAEWQGRIVAINGTEVQPKTDQPRRFVGVPTMTAIGRHLAVDVPIQRETRIVRLERIDENWHITDDSAQTRGPFSHVIVSSPAPQTAELLGDHRLAVAVRAVPMTPCWSVMTAFEKRAQVAWDGAFVHNSPLAWVARNSSKPGRDSTCDCWVLQASADWSGDHLQSSADDVAAMLLRTFAELTGAPAQSAFHLKAHRWRFSATPLSLDRLALFDADTRLAVCGDWLAGGRIEGAYHSGVAAARFLRNDVDSK